MLFSINDLPLREEIRGPTVNCCLVARTPEMVCNLATVVLLQHEFIYFLA